MMFKSSQGLSIVTVLIILGIKCKGEELIDQKESKEIDNINIVPLYGDRKSEMPRVNVLSSHHNSRRSLMKNRVATHDNSITSTVNRMPPHVKMRKSNAKLHQMRGIKRKNWQKKQLLNRSAYNRNKSSHSSQHSVKRRGRNQSLMKHNGGRTNIGQKRSSGGRSVIRKNIDFDRNRKLHSFDKRLKYLRRQRKNDSNCIMDRARVLRSIHNSPPSLDALFS